MISHFSLPSVAVIVVSAALGVFITWISGGLKKVEMKEVSKEQEDSKEDGKK